MIVTIKINVFLIMMYRRVRLTHLDNSTLNSVPFPRPDSACQFSNFCASNLSHNTSTRRLADKNPSFLPSLSHIFVSLSLSSDRIDEKNTYIPIIDYQTYLITLDVESRRLARLGAPSYVLCETSFASAYYSPCDFRQLAKNNIADTQAKTVIVSWIRTQLHCSCKSGQINRDFH